MLAVIFIAKVGKQDQSYLNAASELRKLAFEQYGCLDFVSATEGPQEIAISYWPDEESIQAWKQDTMHLLAQKYGQEQWYESYQVQIVEVKRQYSFPTAED
ncbi:antibiotic biosynthesis monooxygenase [Saccharobesus litoralis]|uniref:Antibiotic biosynthesis monooxygenase n=1 Tax=Saccharobesus litoralis TaxID=2172099 RepID=A0A2S0VXP2_9ALTE|nr:antibiotic biosynthesis monooxygenase [Saccharobesus litoralis]AWB68984.1 antibiotic biosynthesis monooxygenase [Saccharobesus litoralis]